MIQIDDAGSGSLIGGTLIGIMRVESHEYFNDIIPVKYFTTPYFEKKEYTVYCIEIIKKAIKVLDIKKTENIQICQGYIFDKARDYLKGSGYNFESTRISLPLQDIIERSFMDYVVKIGVPNNYMQYTRYPFHFHRLLKWVFADYNKRYKLCKTGWKSWKKYSEAKVASYFDYLYSGSYSCLKCGKPIEMPCRIRVLNFTSNRNYSVYLHENC
jgi:hypothetical protein